MDINFNYGFNFSLHLSLGFFRHLKGFNYGHKCLEPTLIHTETDPYFLKLFYALDTQQYGF